MGRATAMAVRCGNSISKSLMRYPCSYMIYTRHSMAYRWKPRAIYRRILADFAGDEKARNIRGSRWPIRRQSSKSCAKQEGLARLLCAVTPGGARELL